MAKINPVFWIKSICDFIRGKEKQIKKDIDELRAYLEGSEYKLIELLVDNNIWEGKLPPKPDTEGEYEFGIIPYFLNNPPSIFKDFSHANALVTATFKKLSGELIKSQINNSNFKRLMKRITSQHGISGTDGTLLGTGKYEQFDKEWLYMFINYCIVKFGDDTDKFPIRKDYTKVQLNGKADDHVRICIIGDWGTGDFDDYNNPSPAIEVIRQVMKQEPRPDYLIHLGDVYYTGTGCHFSPKDEVLQNLLQYWPDTKLLPAGRSFNLNSNHDMTSGGYGYFTDSLSDKRFSAQEGYSYFALEYGEWTIVGLDSAYFDKSALFMQGSIGDTSSPQVKWLKKLKLNPERTIVMTHHNAFEQTGQKLVHKGKNKQTLWKEVQQAVGGSPAFWYWGHLHNGIVYKTPNFDGSLTKCRCVGHSAIPFGNAFKLEQEMKKKSNNFVEYYANTPDKRINNGVRVLNGYAMLNIYQDGKIEEAFYEVGNPNPVWNRKN